MWWLQSLHRQQYGAAGFNLSATNCADLKPENFLLKNRTGSIEKDNLRAVDFGLSSIHRDGMICKQIVGSGESFALSRLHGLDCLTANSNGAQHSGPTAQLLSRACPTACSVLPGTRGTEGERVPKTCLLKLFLFLSRSMASLDQLPHSMLQWQMHVER